MPTSISSTKALTLTFERSAIVINIVPPPTAEVGDEMTCPTSTGLEIMVPWTGDLTIVSSNAIFAFSYDTSVLTTLDFA